MLEVLEHSSVTLQEFVSQMGKMDYASIDSFGVVWL